jgi:hypothetical protein
VKRILILVGPLLVLADPTVSATAQALLHSPQRNESEVGPDQPLSNKRRFWSSILRHDVHGTGQWAIGPPGTETSLRAAAKILAALTVLITVGLMLVSTAAAVQYHIQSVTAWRKNAAPMGWSASLNRIIYNSRGTDGMFDAYSANPDGTNPRCLTCAIPIFPGVGAATNRGASDVSPDGRYMLLEVEGGAHSGHIGMSISQPGKGTYNNVWLATTDGAKAWRLTDINTDGSLGTMWARFDRLGRRIVWAELYSPAVFNLGYWRLKVADIVWDGRVPSLTKIETIEPSPHHFYEPYGFTPDGSHIIFASDVGMQDWWDSQIYSIATNRTGLIRLSPADAPTGFFTNYNEFAFYLPDDSGIIYGRTRDAFRGGMDYWVMNPDGTGSQRLTYFNEPWNTDYMGYTVVGGLAFDPNDPDRFVADVATDVNAQHLNAVMVTMNPASSHEMLTGRYFADTGFTDLVRTRDDDLWNGLKWDTSPAPGVPPSYYSVRWTGAIDPAVSGNYTFCAIADSGMRLWVSHKLLVDGWWSFGKRECAEIRLQASAVARIRLDYWHGFGTAYVQLSTITPSSGRCRRGSPAARRRGHRISGKCSPAGGRCPTGHRRRGSPGSCQRSKPATGRSGHSSMKRPSPAAD